jgi:hypothetical protein
MGKTYKENKDKYKRFVKNKPNKFKGDKPRHNDEPSEKGWENLPNGGRTGDVERY